MFQLCARCWSTTSCSPLVSNHVLSRCCRLIHVACVQVSFTLVGSLQSQQVSLYCPSAEVPHVALDCMFAGSCLRRLTAPVIFGPVVANSNVPVGPCIWLRHGTRSTSQLLVQSLPRQGLLLYRSCFDRLIAVRVQAAAGR